MLHSLAVVEEVLRESEAVLWFQFGWDLGYRWLLWPLLGVLDLGERFLPRSLVDKLLLLLRILGGIGDFADLDLGLVIVDSLDYLVVAYLPRVVCRQRVDAVVPSKVLQLVLLACPLLFPELPGEGINLLLQSLLLKEALVLHVVHVLDNAAFLLNCHPQQLQGVKEELFLDQEI
jgi:hypothetical protein